MRLVKLLMIIRILISRKNLLKTIQCFKSFFMKTFKVFNCPTRIRYVSYSIGLNSCKI